MDRLKEAIEDVIREDLDMVGVMTESTRELYEAFNELMATGQIDTPEEI